MTTRLRSNFAGRGQPRYTRRRLTSSIAFLATSGNKPSSTNAPTTPSERMPRGDSMAASCVPAFTYTSVPASMPSWLTQ